ncbi:threonine--tRNA ligase [Candidatus Gottesmanbacteria bacterium]|nr:threonine--tRNA ligase [Candidatus Gottesmanbacteria bacterium]
MEKNNNKYLDTLRHSAAHLLAKAVLELWPGTHNAIGPAIENGFYQDFDMGSTKISESDLPKIEEKMREILPSWNHFEFQEVSLEQAKKIFKENPYKVELAKEFAKDGKALKTNNPGNFLDLCKMGHVDYPSKELKYFKLLSIAGAYWRGNEKNKMLTRIYGTCFPTKDELDTYLWQQEEAKKRDHKKIGKALELFLFSPTVGPGLPIFMPKGEILRRIIEDYLVKLKESYGLQFVWTPHIARTELYKQSKHWHKYDAMMPPLKVEEDEYTLKPMNCPHHFQIYLEKPRSYRDLPLRLAENSTVYRYEKSGVLNGLFRVRSVTQDDSHWFVKYEEVQQEIDRAISLTKEVYDAFGLKNFRARISVRDKSHLEKYLGEGTVWDNAEKELEDAVNSRKIPYEIGTGEAAFYGPKIDFLVKDSLSREWQLTTIQLDFNQPENFDLNYTDADGGQKRPAILHIAIIGATERFLAILIEHYAGKFPLWISPVQVKIIPIADRHNSTALAVFKKLREENIRVELDSRSESMQSKIRDASLQKIPFTVIIGDKEQESSDINTNTYVVTVRERSGENRQNVALSAFLEELKTQIEKKL